MISHGLGKARYNLQPLFKGVWPNRNIPRYADNFVNFCTAQNQRYAVLVSDLEVIINQD